MNRRLQKAEYCKCQVIFDTKLVKRRLKEVDKLDVLIDENTLLSVI